MTKPWATARNDLLMLVEAWRAWRNQLLAPWRRKKLPPPRTMIGHQCTDRCPYFVHGSVWTCELSGNAHICDADHCEEIREQKEFGFCALTRTHYPLPPVEEEPKRRFANSGARSMSFMKPTVVVASVDKKRMTASQGDVENSTSSTVASSPTAERKDIVLLPARQTARKNATTRAQDTEEMKQIVRRKLRKLLLTHPESPSVSGEATSSATAVARKKNARATSIDCRRIQKRARRVVQESELTHEFCERMATLCIKTWDTLTTVPEIASQKTYTFDLHTVVVLEYASNVNGFRSELIQIPPEELLIAGFPICSKFESYGITGFNDAQTIFLAITGRPKKGDLF